MALWRMWSEAPNRVWPYFCDLLFKILYKSLKKEDLIAWFAAKVVKLGSGGLIS